MYKTKSGIRFSISDTKYFNNNEILVYKLLYLQRNKKKGIMAKNSATTRNSSKSKDVCSFCVFSNPSSTA